MRTWFAHHEHDGCLLQQRVARPPLGKKEGDTRHHGGGDERADIGNVGLHQHMGQLTEEAFGDLGEVGNERGCRGLAREHEAQGKPTHKDKNQSAHQPERTSPEHQCARSVREEAHGGRGLTCVEGSSLSVCEGLACDKSVACSREGFVES